MTATENQIRIIEERLKDKYYTDIQMLDDALAAKTGEFSQLNDSCIRLENELTNHSNVRSKAEEILAFLGTTESAWQRISKLAELADGAAGTGGKLSFERFAMGSVFREILGMANLRMEQISGGKYELVHRMSTDRKNSKAGLEIEVMDHDTGQTRSSGSLSGGEKFFTSMALALGLSDVVQNHAGGKSMETLFIDEGFGSLDDDVLDRALGVLEQLTYGDRLVGVISHVDKLDESIPQKIVVRRGAKGSKVEMILA